MAGGAALGGFLSGLTQGMEFRQRLRDRDDDRKQREEDRLWRIEDRNVEANDRARKAKWDEEDRAAAAEDRKRRRAAEDERITAAREERARRKELQSREDASYFEEQGDKKAAADAYSAAKTARDKDVESNRMTESKAAAGLGVLAPVDEQATVLPGSALERAAMRGITPQVAQQPRLRPDAEEPLPPVIEPYNQTPQGETAPQPMDPPALDFAPPRDGAPAPAQQQPSPVAPPQPGLLSRLNPFGAANAAEVDPMQEAQRLSAPPPAAAAGIAPTAQIAAPRPVDPGAAPGEAMAADPMQRAQQLSRPGPALDAIIGAQPPSPGAPPDTPPAALKRGAVGPGAVPPVYPQPASLPAAMAGITAPGSAAAAETPPSVKLAAATAGPRAAAAPQAAAASKGLGLLREPLKSSGDHVADFMSYYQKEAVPLIVEHYLSTGRPESATQFQEWAQGEARKAGMEHWAKGVQAASRGDEGAFLDSMIEAYNSDGYFDDGYEIVRKGSSLRKDDAGNTLGATLVFKDQETGEETTRNLDVEDIYETGVLFLAPEQVYEHGVNRMAETRKAQTAAEDRRRKAAGEAQKALSQDPAFTALSAEEQDARVQDWVDRQEAAAHPQASRAASRSPANWTGDE